MVFIESNHFVHRLFRGISTFLGVLDLLRIASFLNDEIENVQHDKADCLLLVVRERLSRGGRRNFGLDGFESLGVFSLIARCDGGALL
jgi:hypothetical protein